MRAESRNGAPRCAFEGLASCEAVIGPRELTRGGALLTSRRRQRWQVGYQEHLSLIFKERSSPKVLKKRQTLPLKLCIGIAQRVS